MEFHNNACKSCNASHLWERWSPSNYQKATSADVRGTLFDTNCFLQHRSLPMPLPTTVNSLSLQQMTETTMYLLKQHNLSAWPNKHTKNTASLVPDGRPWLLYSWRHYVARYKVILFTRRIAAYGGKWIQSNLLIQWGSCETASISQVYCDIATYPGTLIQMNQGK